MSQLQERFDEELERLRQRRDELRVKLDLGKMEARDAWAAAEKSWVRLEGKVGQLAREGEEVADDVKDAVEHLVDEVKDGFARLKSMI